MERSPERTRGMRRNGAILMLCTAFALGMLSFHLMENGHFNFAFFSAAMNGALSASSMVLLSKSKESR